MSLRCRLHFDPEIVLSWSVERFPREFFRAEPNLGAQFACMAAKLMRYPFLSALLFSFFERFECELNKDITNFEKGVGPVNSEH
jgi:hypothetical protein